MSFSRINISVFDLVRNLPQFNRSHYRFARLPFDLFRPYAHLLEEKYRGRTGNYQIAQEIKQKLAETLSCIRFSGNSLDFVCMLRARWYDRILHRTNKA